MIITQFELFCMIFYVVDFAWDKSQDEALLKFLSNANPFLFTDIGSEVFVEFCERVPEIIPVEKSFSFAKKYIASLKSKAISDAFSTVNKQQWFTGLKKYISQPHKK